MRTRDEVLREWSYSSESECTWLELKLIDRIRELEQERHEDEGVVSVWRGRTERAENRLRELEALVDTLTARNLDLNIECDGLEDELRHPTTPTRGSDE